MYPTYEGPKPLNWKTKIPLLRGFFVPETRSIKPAWECSWEHLSKGYRQQQISTAHLHARATHIRCQHADRSTSFPAPDHLRFPNHLTSQNHSSVFRTAKLATQIFHYWETHNLQKTYPVRKRDGSTILLKDPMLAQPSKVMQTLINSTNVC